MDRNGDPPKRIWKEVIDPPSRSVYYWNLLTGETTWRNPVPEDIFPPFRERVAHDTKVILDKLANGVDRIKFFFDEIDLINDVCDRLREEEIGSVQSAIKDSLESLDKLLDVATPGTKSYSKFLDLKRFLSEQRSYLKNNGAVSEDLLGRIGQATEEVSGYFANVERFSVRSDELADDYKAYLDKRRREKQEHEQRGLDRGSEEPSEPPEPPTNEPERADRPKHAKTSAIRSLHQRWSRASEIIDEAEAESNFKRVNQSKGLALGSEEENPNLVPITKRWNENQA